MHPNTRRNGHYGNYSAWDQHSSQQPYDWQADRRASFDYGDDSNLRQIPSAQQQVPLHAYTQSMQGYGAATQPNPGSVTLPPLRTSQASYNPANYARSESQMNTPTIASTQVVMPAGNYAAAHVPYNPAAYQNPSPQQSQGAFTGQAYQAYAGSPSFSSYAQGQGPQLPPKPPELQQTNSPYPRPSDRRGAVSTASSETQSPYNQPSSTNFPAYNTPPAPPDHQSPANYNLPQYQAYSPPIPQVQQAPPPPQHRRLPSVPGHSSENNFGVTSPQSTGRSWAPRMPGASLPSGGQRTPSQLSLNRPTSSQSTQSRPLPPAPPAPPIIDEVSSNNEPNGETLSNGRSGYDEIPVEVEAAVMGRPDSVRRSNAYTNTPPRQESTHSISGLFPTTSRQFEISPDTGQTHTNQAGITTSPSAASPSGYAAYDDDSDGLAAAGLQAMQMAEEEENRPGHRSFRSAGSFDTYQTDTSVENAQPLQRSPEQGSGSDSEGNFVGVDISAGFDPGMGHYGYGEYAKTPTTLSQFPSDGEPTPTGSSMRGSSMTNEPVDFPAGKYEWASADDDLVSPKMTARVDRGGTGGLAEPTARRLSFDDGDEATLVDYSDRSGRTSPSKTDSYLRRNGSRPLPPTPNDDKHVSPRQEMRYPTAPDEYESTYAGTENIRKANSLGGVHSHAPSALMPERSITDAEQRRKHLQKGNFYEIQAKADAAFPGPDELDLPAIPAGRRRKFIPSKLSSKDYAECYEPWAISNILAWIRDMTEGESDLREQPIVDAIVGLFTHKVPTMNIADAEVLSATLVHQMIQEAALVRDEEWVKFSGIRMSGVIYQLTGTGCYSPKVHTMTMQGRCYSHHCMRTLKKIDLQTNVMPPEKKVEDWATFYKLTKGNIEGKEKKEIERQNNLHEIVTSEDYYIDQLDVLLLLYRDGLAKAAQPIIALTGKQSKFISEVFDKVPAVKKANEDHLLAQLKYRQQEQGPWIVGFSDIFREWIRKARTAYIEYATGLPNAIMKVKLQSDQNVLFKQFLDQVREHPRSKRLDWNTYLKAPITRLQRYGLLLETVRKNMPGDSQEKLNLEVAIKEIKEVTLECDGKVAEMTKRSDMLDLSSKLKLRSGMENVQLNLNHLGRQIIHRGDLTRRGNNNMTWVDTHAILFDHYMVLSKSTKSKDSNGSIKSEFYDVSKLPIPMDLLVLESADDGVVMKHSVKGIIPMGPTPMQRPLAGGTGNSSADLRLTKTNTAGQGGMPQAQRSQSSPAGGITPIGIYSQTVQPDNENLMYPFKVQHLGKSEVYVLYASSAKIRQEWAEKIIYAKKLHAASLFAQNAEPFKLRVLADTAFAYGMESPGGLPVHIPGTPLDRALRDLERDHGKPKPRPAPVCRSVINCATAFTPPFSGRALLAVGTDFGVFITEQNSPRGWYKAVNATHVSQIQVLEDFSVLLIIADKALIAFHLDAVVPPTGGAANNTSDLSSRRTPQKLSGSRDVGFFAVGRMKERMLVFYKKREGISSTFKVLEPVYHKTGTATSSSSGSGWGRSRFGMKKASTDFFRDFDDFYIASETYCINLFASSLAVATAKGIEVLTLDKKVPFSIPDLRPVEVQSIAGRISNQKPLGMFRLTDNEFLLVFEEVGIYVDKHGDVSRAVIMEFVGKAKQASLHASMYLILVDVSGGFVEVRNAVNGRLRQVISGRDVKMLDDGMAAGATNVGNQAQAGVSRGTVKISMQHPELERGYVVLEMTVNEGINE